LLHRLRDLWHNFKCITDNTVISSLEERRFSIFIDDNYYLASVDASQMLNGTADTNCDIKIWSNCHSCLSNVFVMRSPMCIGNRTTTRECGAQCFGEFFHHAPVLRSFQSATRAHH